MRYVDQTNALIENKNMLMVQPVAPEERFTTAYSWDAYASAAVVGASLGLLRHADAVGAFERVLALCVLAGCALVFFFLAYSTHSSERRTIKLAKATATAMAASVSSVLPGLWLAEIILLLAVGLTVWAAWLLIGPSISVPVMRDGFRYVPAASIPSVMAVALASTALFAALSLS